MNETRRTPGMRGTRSFVALLPSGDAVWMRVRPAPVPLREIDRLTDTVNATDRRRLRGMEANAVATRRVVIKARHATRAATRETVDRATRLQRRAAKGDGALARRLDIEVCRLRRETRGTIARERAARRRLRREGYWTALLAGSALLLVTVFGERRSPWASNNLAISIGLLLWLFGDDLSDLLSGRSRRSDELPISPGIWLYLAPFANLLLGYLLFHAKARAHEKFEPLSGTTTRAELEVETEVISTPEGAVQRDVYWKAIPLDPVFRSRPGMQARAAAAVASHTLRTGLTASEAELEEPAAALVDGHLMLILAATAPVEDIDAQPEELPPLLEDVVIEWKVDMGSATA